MKFEIYPRKDGKFGYRLKGNNGEIVLAAEGFHSAGNARRAIKRVKEEAANAKVIELKEEKGEQA